MKLTPVLLGLLLAGCRNEAPPPAPTSEQSEQLDEAEAMLNDLANEEGPADRSTGPSEGSN